MQQKQNITSGSADSKQYVIVNAQGEYFNGLAMRKIDTAKKYTRADARSINHIIMCGSNKVVKLA